MSVKSILAAVAVASAMFVSNVSLAADKETKPAESKSEAKSGEVRSTADASSVKLTKPWSDITGLTDEQRVKIDALHKKALAEINAIEKREREEITALLTDAQKAEMKDAAAKKKKDMAAKRAAEKKADGKYGRVGSHPPAGPECDGAPRPMRGRVGTGPTHASPEERNETSDVGCRAVRARGGRVGPAVVGRRHHPAGR